MRSAAASTVCQLRALMASGRKLGMLITLHFELVEVEAGRAVFAGTPGEQAYNPIGADLYGPGAEGDLSQANYQGHRTLACGGSVDTRFCESFSVLNHPVQ
jgi:hypothetical protein